MCDKESKIDSLINPDVDEDSIKRTRPLKSETYLKKSSI